MPESSLRNTSTPTPISPLPTTTMSVDRFYGFRDTAELCEHVITSLFSVTTPPAPTSAKDAIPPLGEFIAYALYRTRLPLAITHQALLLLGRLKARYPSARGTSTSPHRLFLSSLMLSSKISMDDTYSNKSWQVVGQGLFELRELNCMERECFAFLGWNVVVRDEELTRWVHDVVDVYEAQRDAAKASALCSPPASPAASTSSAAFASALAAPVDERKRRRESTGAAPPTPSSSRSPSPEELRHRRASDAAVAILHGGHDPASYDTTLRTRRRRPQTPDRPSPYSACRTTSSSSSSSSTVSSPLSGTHSPHTPVSDGLLTPEHTDVLEPAVWGHYSYPTPSSKGDSKAVVLMDAALDAVEGVAQW